MRWLKEPLRNRVGQTRIRDRFMFLPKCIKNETRWLERTMYVQQVHQVTVEHWLGSDTHPFKWKDEYWIAKEKEENLRVDIIIEGTSNFLNYRR